MWVAASLVGFTVVSNIGLLLPAISDDLGLSVGQQGILGSAAFWGAMVMAIPLTWWMSRYSPRWAVTVILMLCAAFMAMQAWAPAFAILIVGRLAFGLALLAIDPPGAMLVQQWFAQRQIVMVNSVGNALFGILLGLGMLVTPFILHALGSDWRLTFYIFAGCFGVLAVLWMVLVRERSAEPRKRRGAVQEGDSVWAILSQRDLLAAGLGMLGYNLAMNAFLTFFPTFVLKTHDISLEWSGGILATQLIVGGVAGLGIGYFVTTTGKRKEALVVLGLLMAAGFVGMTLTGSIPLLFVSSFLAGVAFGGSPVIYSVSFQLPRSNPRRVAIAVSMMMVTIAAGTVVGPLMTGFLEGVFDGLRVPLIIAGCAGLAMSVTGLTLRRAPKMVPASAVATAPVEERVEPKPAS
jgi:ACS family D-galactonate transporter-like MFS transporter